MENVNYFKVLVRSVVEVTVVVVQISHPVVIVLRGQQVFLTEKSVAAVDYFKVLVRSVVEVTVVVVQISHPVVIVILQYQVNCNPKVMKCHLVNVLIYQKQNR